MIITTVFDMGSTVKDKITGFKGVVVAMYVYQHGCIRVEVTSRDRTKDNDSVSKTFDEPRLTLVRSTKPIDLMTSITSKEGGNPTWGDRDDPPGIHDES